MKKMKIRSKNSNKAMAVVTGTLTAQYDLKTWASADEAFRREVEATAAHPVGPTAIRRPDDAIVEVNLRAEYGPSLGGCESDLLRSIPRAVEGHALIDGAVFSVSRKEKTKEEAAVIITDNGWVDLAALSRRARRPELVPSQVLGRSGRDRKEIEAG